MTEAALIAGMLCVAASGHVPVERVESVGPAIYREAVAAGEDPVLIAAVSYVETRWRNARSSAGACGVMQVIPRFSKWTCKQMRNTRVGVRAGIRAIKYWRDKRKKGKKYKGVGWLCHYNSGNRCYRRSHGYARSVAYVAKRLRRGRSKCHVSTK